MSPPYHDHVFRNNLSYSDWDAQCDKHFSGKTCFFFFMLHQHVCIIQQKCIHSAKKKKGYIYTHTHTKAIYTRTYIRTYVYIYKLFLSKIFQIYAKCMLTVQMFQTEIIVNLQMPKYITKCSYFKWQKGHLQSLNTYWADAKCVFKIHFVNYKCI